MAKSSGGTAVPTTKAATPEAVRTTTASATAKAVGTAKKAGAATTGRKKAVTVTAPAKKTAAPGKAASAPARRAATKPGGDVPAATTAAAGRRAARGAASPASRPRSSTPEAQPIAEGLAVGEDESPWTAEELQQVQTDLLAERDVHRREIEEAEAELGNLLRGSGDGAGDDQADAGAKTFEREHEIALANNARDMLRQVERALEQLGAGTYGVCENCGRPIGKLRLQAYPRATLCMPCKKNQERH